MYPLFLVILVKLSRYKSLFFWDEPNFCEEYILKGDVLWSVMKDDILLFVLERDILWSVLKGGILWSILKGDTLWSILKGDCASGARHLHGESRGAIGSSRLWTYGNVSSEH